MFDSKIPEYYMLHSSLIRFRFWRNLKSLFACEHLVQPQKKNCKIIPALKRQLSVFIGQIHTSLCIYNPFSIRVFINCYRVGQKKRTLTFWIRSPSSGVGSISSLDMFQIHKFRCSYAKIIVMRLITAENQHHEKIATFFALQICVRIVCFCVLCQCVCV